MKPIHILFLSYLLLSTQGFLLMAQSQIVVLKGATLLDFDQYGSSQNDITDAVVILQGGKVQQIGKLGQVKIPKSARQINISGKFLVPGLIDGFATLNNQAYANAFLYMGVTTLVGLDNDNRRGSLFYGANPSPTIVKLEDYFGCQYKRIADTTSGQPNTFRIDYVNDYSPDKTRKVIDSLASTGVKVLLIHYGVKPEQLSLVVEQARKHGMVTIGELGRSTYKQAVQAGVQSFVHTSATQWICYHRLAGNYIPTRLLEGVDKPIISILVSTRTYPRMKNY
jgi:hypothetical protein